MNYTLLPYILLGINKLSDGSGSLSAFTIERALTLREAKDAANMRFRSGESAVVHYMIVRDDQSCAVVVSQGRPPILPPPPPSLVWSA